MWSRTWLGRWRSAFVLVVAGIAIAWLAATGDMRRSFDAVVYQRPFPTGLFPPMTELVEWINEHTDDSARILFEDQLRLREATVPESLHWTPLLPILTGRQFVGGQYQTAPIKHHHASFGDFQLGGRPIEDYSVAGLERFRDLYNIGWVICWSPAARNAFDLYPGAERVAELPRYTDRPTENRYFLYRLAHDRTFFARGQGKVVAVDYNRIELADLAPDAGLVVLKYHWLDQFRTQPAVPLERVDLGGDPIGFIGIRTDRPIERLVIETVYW